MDPASIPPGIPIIGAQQKPRIFERPIVPIKLQDREGIAELVPQTDLTVLEVFSLTQLLLWITTQPPPQTDGRGNVTSVIVTPWRRYIAEQGLERHFTFTLSMPLTNG